MPRAGTLQAACALSVGSHAPDTLLLLQGLRLSGRLCSSAVLTTKTPVSQDQGRGTNWVVSQPGCPMEGGGLPGSARQVGGQRLSD